MSEKIRVRYAPSPTGELHVGNARTALFNYLFARHHGGEFIIRIEDTDKKRNIDHGEASQLANLEWLGIDWDESPDKPGEYGPYRQSERFDIYDGYIEQLIEEGKAYYAYDTAEELEEAREQQRAEGVAPHYIGKWRDASEEEVEEARAKGHPESIRFRVPEEGVFIFEDIVKGHIEFEADSVGGDFVIRKSDGSPTYNFAVVVDDHLMNITHVLRGDDHIANTPRQMMIYEALGWKTPVFGHMTLITNAETGRKLSKRDHNVLQFIEQYRDLGYHPEGVFNYIAFLGWTPEGERELYSREELIEVFDENRLSRSPASFNQEKLDWMSHEYIKAMDVNVLAEQAKPFLVEAGYINEESGEDTELVYRLVELFQGQMEYVKQIVDLSAIFFKEEGNISEQAADSLKEETAKAVVEAFRDKVAALETVDNASVKPLIKEVQKEVGVKGKQLFMPLRAALIGEAHGPGADELVVVYGQEKAIEQLNKTLENM